MLTDPASSAALSALLDDYVADLEKLGRASSTVRAYAYYVGRLAAWSASSDLLQQGLAGMPPSSRGIAATAWRSFVTFVGDRHDLPQLAARPRGPSTSGAGGVRRLSDRAVLRHRMAVLIAFMAARHDLGPAAMACVLLRRDAAGRWSLVVTVGQRKGDVIALDAIDRHVVQSILRVQRTLITNREVAEGTPLLRAPSGASLPTLMAWSRRAPASQVKLGLSSDPVEATRQVCEAVTGPRPGWDLADLDATAVPAETEAAPVEPVEHAPASAPAQRPAPGPGVAVPIPNPVLWGGPSVPQLPSPRRRPVVAVDVGAADAGASPAAKPLDE